MEYKSDFDIDTFNFWAGAEDRMNDATDEQREAVDERLQELFEDSGDIPTETEINDVVWFECDDIFYPEEEQ